MIAQHTLTLLVNQKSPHPNRERVS
jgi:hypothetical protein